MGIARSHVVTHILFTPLDGRVDDSTQLWRGEIELVQCEESVASQPDTRVAMAVQGLGAALDHRGKLSPLVNRFGIFSN